MHKEVGGGVREPCESVQGVSLCECVSVSAWSPSENGGRFGTDAQLRVTRRGPRRPHLCSSQDELSRGTVGSGLGITFLPVSDPQQHPALDSCRTDTLKTQ